MIQTVEAVIDSTGCIRLIEDVPLPKGCRAFVTVLDEATDIGTFEPALLTEESLAQDWLRPEEDEAWSHPPRQTPEQQVGRKRLSSRNGGKGEGISRKGMRNYHGNLPDGAKEHS